MTFKPSIWYPIALTLSVLNLVAVGFAIRPGQPWEHAGMHVALAMAFGLWAQRLGQRRGADRDVPDRLDAFEDEMSKLRQELNETQERLDFAERVLAQGRESPRVGPQR
ncbi:MAG TPA: hypothetical protein VN848_13660 [Gemmatimonadales bacterium]|nr:hypothetical protein [Gemmatimonadales bacterium]